VKDRQRASAQPGSRRRETVRALLLLLALDFTMFADVLFLPGSRVASDVGGDVRAYFGPVREFTYAEIGNGNLPLWNPYTYSGTPLLAGFQSAMLYPLNAHYLFLPLAKALNLEIFLHVFLLGAGFYLWSRRHVRTWYAAAFGSTIIMFSGSYFPHIQAGHLTLLSAWAWAPLVLYAIDRYVPRCRSTWIAIGSLALTMAIYAGHPQGVFGTILAAGAYGLLACAFRPKGWWCAPGLAAMFLAPLFLGAAQLWPALAMAPESVRSGGLSFEVAQRFSFPLENLVTILAPKFFGDSVGSFYWGQWFYWEMSAFIGVVAALLAGYGLICGKSRERFALAAIMIAIALIALGSETPLFKLLYEYVPGFDQFRSPSKFMFCVTIFACMLVTLGADALITTLRHAKYLGIAASVLTAILLAASLRIADQLRSGAWQAMLETGAKKEGAFWIIGEGLDKVSAGQAQYALFIAAGTAAAVAALLFMAPGREWCVPAILLLGIAEVFFVARSVRPSMNYEDLRNRSLAAFLNSQPDGYRVWNLGRDNNLLPSQVRDFWGYDPASLRRYVELFARTKGANATESLNEVWFDTYHPSFALAGCRFLVDSSNADVKPKVLPNPLPRLSFPREVRIVENAEERIALVLDATFDPRQSLILESEPAYAPDGSAIEAVATIADESTDHLVVEVSTPRECVMLMTDAFANDWRVTPDRVGPQTSYTIQPANHAFRAIPLAAGSHRIRLEYRPPAFGYGAIASGLSTFLLGTFAVVQLVRRKSVAITT